METMVAAVDMKAAIVVLASFLVGSSSYGQVCTPAVAVARQFRSSLSHRTSGASTGHRTSVAEMLRWSAPVGVADDAMRGRAAAIDPRENNRYTLDGDAWRVGYDPADCGVYAEIADPGSGPDAPRVLVLLPQERTFQSLRDALLATLPNGRLPGRGNHVDLRATVRIRVTGFGFYNGAYWSHVHPQAGDGHGTTHVGTLWEIRPVQQLTVLPLVPTLEAPVAPQNVPTVVPAVSVVSDAGSATPHADHVRCCDGTSSRECRCDREDFRGCCVHHGGICGGCGE